MTNPEKHAFKRELKALLECYKVSIDFRCGEFSDWHGVYDARLEVTDIETREPILIFEDTSIDLYELKNNCTVVKS